MESGLQTLPGKGAAAGRSGGAQRREPVGPWSGGGRMDRRHRCRTRRHSGEHGAVATPRPRRAHHRRGRRPVRARRSRRRNRRDRARRHGRRRGRIAATAGPPRGSPPKARPHSALLGAGWSEGLCCEMCQVAALFDLCSSWVIGRMNGEGQPFPADPGRPLRGVHFL